jgi:hypothetical protein
MTCVDVRERLSAWVDGEDPEPAGVEAHLRGCPSCSAAAEELRAEIAALDRVLAPVADRAEAGAGRALAALPPDPAARPAGMPWWSVALAAAAGFLLATVFVKGEPEGVPKPVATPGAARSGEATRREVARILDDARVGCFATTPDRELKAMGTACVGPVADWIAKADPERDAAGRRFGVAVVADLATMEHAPRLVELLGDGDAEVRLAADRGLRRLTGRSPVEADACRRGDEGLQELWKECLQERD